MAASLTSRFDLREEGSDLLALHDVRDDVTCDLWAGAVGDDHGRATLQSPQSRFHLQRRRQNTLSYLSKTRQLVK